MIGIVYGTRPEYIKIKPLLEEFRKSGIDFRVLKVEQHTDLIDEYEYDELIPVGNGDKIRLNAILAGCFTHSFHEEMTDIIVQGDTTTAMSVALNAFHCGIKVMHLEAGLRTYDKENPHPEEVNRRIISSIASVHFCPTERDRNNLIKEGFEKDQIYVTGNTALDNLRDIKPARGNEVLITLHRRENHPYMREWFIALEELAEMYPHYSFVFPMHPSPAVQKHRWVFNKVEVCDPLSIEEMQQRLSQCAYAITDSGGIQEECSFFNKVCLVCRKVTERPSSSSIICESPQHLTSKFMLHNSIKVKLECPFGDGYAARKITKHVKELLRRV